MQLKNQSKLSFGMVNDVKLGENLFGGIKIPVLIKFYWELSTHLVLYRCTS